MYQRRFYDYPIFPISNIWKDVFMTGFSEPKTYVVQTGEKIIARCLLMTTDPGDLVLDPTAGAGTTAHVAEQWGRRWIAIDTSRVALALARARVMGAKYPAYTLRDSPEGQARMEKEGWATPRAEARPRFDRDVAMGFVCERVPHITLKAIANNPAIDDPLGPPPPGRRGRPRPPQRLAARRAPEGALRNRPGRPQGHPHRLHRGGRDDHAVRRDRPRRRPHGMGGPARLCAPRYAWRVHGSCIGCACRVLDRPHRPPARHRQGDRSPRPRGRLRDPPRQALRG